MCNFTDSRMTAGRKSERRFPDNFLFGTGTSAYQIEGAAAEDGRTPSIWDIYCENPDHIYRGASGYRACDHYHRVDEDIALMQKIGINSYRFSISWSRIYPTQGEVNQKGIDFYTDLVRKLQEAAITPVVTLYHWDLPQWAAECGGWLNRDSINWFVQFSETMFKALGNTVPYWITFNEPFCVTMLGYLKGLHAPGHTDLKEALTAAHHLNLAHGMSVRKFREVSPGRGSIGTTLNISPGAPLEETEENRILAQRADEFVNHWFLEPLFKGTYPHLLAGIYEEKIGHFTFFRPGDAEIMTEPIDFLGINYYKRNVVRKDPDGLLGYVGVSDPQPGTLKEWEAYPDILLDVLRMVRKRYTDLPLIITENGLALDGSADDDSDASRYGTYITVKDSVDTISQDGRIHDDERIAYVYNHLRQCLDFIKEGGRLEGYYLWSLMDNFEWALGYSKRFGIIYVDFETLERTIKESGYWYRKVIAARELIL